MVNTNKKIFFVFIMLIIILLIAFIFLNSSKKETIHLVESDEFEKIITNPDVFVLNTHTPYEGEIESTDFIAEDWQNIEKYKENLPEDKSTPIAVYCRSGRMSESAAQQLESLGYKKIYDLKGGMNAWKESGKKIIVN